MPKLDFNFLASLTPSTRHKDLTGRRFDRLTALECLGRTKRQTYWKCRCDCGRLVVVTANALNQRQTKSCGCARFGNKNARHIHSQTGTRTHRTWVGMRQRCLNESDVNYPRYGGRGITIAPQWNSFQKFYKDMGPSPSPDHSIDRIDNNGNYEPNNCRWATKRQQSANTRANHSLTAFGKTQILHEWSRETGLSVHAIVHRLKRGLSAEHALTLLSRRGRKLSKRIHHD